MTGRLAVDFGTSNTVVTVWDSEAGGARPLNLHEWSRQLTKGLGGNGHERSWVIPSLIHYSSGGEQWLGQQVIDKGLNGSPATFRWLKHYIKQQSAVNVNVCGRQVNYFKAGEDFLSAILMAIAGEIQLGDEEVAFTVPVEAFEHYENWLANVAEKSGIRRFALIDEASAAAIGYGVQSKKEDIFMVFDFGGGTLDISIVLNEPVSCGSSRHRCRVIGKAGEDLGGSQIDRWLFLEMLSRIGLGAESGEARTLGHVLLAQCEQAKESLSFQERAEINITDPVSGQTLKADITRNEFEQLLDRHEFFTRIHMTLQRALNGAFSRGYQEDQISSILMVGGCSYIPSVQTLIRQRFGTSRVKFDRPFDAVAQGAAAFVSGTELCDYIQHDYAIRYWNPQFSKYEFRPLVSRGTAYPSEGNVARMLIRATYDGQTQMGIPVFEIGTAASGSHTGDIELVRDSGGGLRLVKSSPKDDERQVYYWMNEKIPTFLLAEPPAKKGETRFEVTFNIDGNKRLLVSARDLATNAFVKRDFPVIKLA
ncbi:MAG: Hsp70 family protein [Methanoregula sp.]|nr:MAG: Hsp70 family protein [Methanoregula sp.]